MTEWLDLSNEAHAAAEALNNAGPAGFVSDRLLKGRCLDEDGEGIGEAYHSADDLRRYAAGMIEIADWLDARAGVEVREIAG